ncbi:Cleavage/polyadenylation specificity factor subunit 5 [Naematelia encephala]|uniref:Cleavage and polyadenylation specificity factor subunit 5 n=1 Tax=Naematelia encephala TaxID=71784 RepID=A0A1Y2BM62_9TREE|nr:Cleavage/polyadenylation specificity factor subunit 5 [Naematelia encephala]
MRRTMLKYSSWTRLTPLSERESQPEEDSSVSARVARLQAQYKETGIRRSVDAVMVVIHMGFPHVLVLQVANSFYKLPGGYLDPSESDVDGLVTRLQEQLGLPATQQPENGPNVYSSEATDWKIHDCLSIWWRPNFDVFLYPYLPRHVTRPKEVKKLYLVELPEHKIMAVPANMKLHAIPFFELYDNAARYGPQFVGLPHILSK